MGVGGSKSPTTGVPANPRVIYADDKSRREKEVSDIICMPWARQKNSPRSSSTTVKAR